MARSPDGTIWISQPQDGNIVAFSASGARTRTLGRRGEGPGEFRIASGISPDGDDLWVYDRESQRLIRFGLVDRKVDVRRVNRPSGLPINGHMMSAGPRGSFYSAHRAMNGSHMSPYEVAFFASRDPIGGRAVGAGTYQGESCSYGSPDGRIAVVIPLCHDLKSAVSPGGGFLAVVEPVARRDGKSAVRVSTHDVGGQLVFRGNVELWPSPLDARTRDSVVTALKNRARPAIASLVERIVAEDLIPWTWPPVTDAAVSDSGVAWFLTRAGTAGTNMVCRARPSAGTAPECAMLPPAAYKRLLWVGSETMVLVEETEEGYQDVVLYRFERN
ncbi:MAG TPA: hypothetical protein PLL69_05875 [Gemmatimonadales bacterium]|nr:hypothetical protein [Gemmatimonadales bacterium]